MKNTLSEEEREKLILDNMALVRYIIKKYIFIADDEIDDLFQVGCLYLTKADSNFDPSLNIKFATYAGSYILNGLKRYKYEQPNKFHGLHFSRTMVSDMYKVSKYIKDNYDIDDTTRNIISEETGIEKNKIDKLIFSVESLDEKTNTEDKVTKAEYTVKYTEKGYEDIEFIMELEQTVKDLSSKLKGKSLEVLNYYTNYFINNGTSPTVTEASNALGVCRRTVLRALRTIKDIYYKD